jgi:hypothetical protein
VSTVTSLRFFCLTLGYRRKRAFQHNLLDRGVRRLERSVLKFAGMTPVRETLLMVDAVSDANRRAWLDRESLWKASHSRRVRTFAMFAGRAASHRRENGRENLKMAVSLEFWHFQPAG